MTASRELAKERGLSKRAIKDIDALHFALASMQIAWVDFLSFGHSFGNATDAAARKSMRKAVRRIEYQLQDLWGFPRNKKLHTWVYTFDGLLEERKNHDD